MKTSPEIIAKMKEIFPPEYPEVVKKDMIPLEDVSWDDMSMKELTCVNHPFARYLTKNPFDRGLHFIQGPNGLTSGIDKECDCSFSDLYVVLSSLKK